MTKGAVMAQLHVARKGFTAMRRGRKELVRPGDVAEEGSWPLKQAPHAFEPLTIRFPAPGSKTAPAPNPPAPDPNAGQDGPEQPAEPPKRGGRGRGRTASTD